MKCTNITAAAASARFRHAPIVRAVRAAAAARIAGGDRDEQRDAVPEAVGRSDPRRDVVDERFEWAFVLDSVLEVGAAVLDGALDQVVDVFVVDVL